MSARWVILLALVSNGCSTPRLEYNLPPKPFESKQTPHIPITDLTPKPTNKQDAKLRRSRDIAYNSKSHKHLGGGLGGHMFVDSIKLDRDFTPSPTVLLAEVTRTQSYLSKDKQNLYTEWTAQVRKIVTMIRPDKLNEGVEISINRVGGAVRMPSGQTYELIVDGIPNPLFTSKTYILFLTYDPCCDWFELDKSWIVENGRVHYVDDWDANSRYEGVSLEKFIHDYQQYRAAFVPGDATNR